MNMFLIYPSILTVAVALSCSNEMKQGPFKLNIPTSSLPNITTLTIRIAKYNLSNADATMVLGYRARWTSYCYNGGALDPNTGCLNNLLYDPPSKTDLEKWSRLQQCEICQDYSNAWGSDAKVCLDRPSACGLWVDSKELSKMSNNNNFAYHTCNLSWRCGVSKSKVPLILKREQEPTIYVALPNGTLKMANEFFLLDGQTSVLIKEKPQILMTKIDVKCVDEGEDYWCVDPDTKNAFRTSKKEPTFCTYGICYEWVSMVKDKKNPTSYRLKHASLEDLQSMFVKEMLEIEDLKYSMLQLAHRTITLENVIINMIISLAKIDDKLLQKILGGDFSTEFLNSETFFIKPCLKEPETSSNCIGNKIFHEGRWITNENQANCIKLLSPRLINLFDALNIWLPEISEYKAQGTPDDYTGWSFFAHNKESLAKTMQYTRLGGLGTSMQDVLNMPEGTLAHAINGIWGLTSVSFLGFAIVVIVVIVICKRL